MTTLRKINVLSVKSGLWGAMMEGRRKLFPVLSKLFGALIIRHTPRFSANSYFRAEQFYFQIRALLIY